MHAYAYPSWQEKVISGAFAFGMHLLFLALLVFGVTWQKRVEPQANIVDLWANLPSPAPPKAVPSPPKAVPPPPKPELKLEVKPPEPPPVKPVAKPEIVKPDIAIKEKAMKEKAEKEKAEKDRRALEEKQKEAKKREAEAKAAQKRQQEKEAEAKAAQKLQQEKEAQARAAREQEDAQRRIAEQQASAQARLRNEYVERIRAKIKRNVNFDISNIRGNPEAEFDVVLLPGGEVLSARLKRASGNAAYDRAVETAIFRAQPLPLPPDPALFRDFRELNLKFRPQE